MVTVHRLVAIIATTFAFCNALGSADALKIQRGFTMLDMHQVLDDKDCWIPEIPALPEVSSNIYKNIVATLSTVQYQQKCISRFQRAIGVDTETNDDFGTVQDDIRWSKFYNFSAFLKKDFPLVHQHLQLERVNCHGLLYTWKPASERDQDTHFSKPFVLMAHQDTVPVSNKSLAEWKYDPFEGHVDKSGIIYGRGAHDDKNSLISIMEAVEHLLKNHFQPKRTVVLAFGFDEEVSGKRGAFEISQVLEQRYGKQGIEFILDEGPGIIDPVAPGGKVAYATVATSEKGYLDVLIEAKGLGGHSSLAGKHTLIGIMAEMIVALETKDPLAPRVSRDSPVIEFLSCQNFSTRDVPLLLRRIRKGDIDAEYDLGLLLQNTSLAVMSRTSQAIDLISGGQKINALPERVSVGINYRIAPGLTLKDIKARITSILEPIAMKYNMTSFFFGSQESVSCSDSELCISQVGKALEPAKMSPQNTKAYSVVFGSVSSALNPIFTETLNVESLVVVPTLMAGNTDTRHFWNLTQNLFRFRPTRIDIRNNGGHTVNEHIHVDDHFASIQFYSSLILRASAM
ncbi:hypothetical protein HG535_0C00230 [Zygotorulaspora mrakii]|uniref:Peptidase M20 dimerisation domain-containing protein n=1 Tax=Zygotorulaspora mrakii TaxID=42260 RepID=A0A7H9AZ30_ZYGMR|nr:uncharacterized protein HG535_0C00230 [Zygotorulaspora mrakii]QLG71675.1 hypothetical protein HG535_0C00230 [Zygotorulaspora mrakii]